MPWLDQAKTGGVRRFSNNGNNRLSLDVLVENVRLCSGTGLRALNL